MLELIRDSAKKVICGADAQEKAVEILGKGTQTLIRFKNDGTIEVNKNLRIKKYKKAR